jgi:hypothetical protein
VPISLDRYAAQTREDVYQGFELLDTLRHDLELKRAERQFHQPELVSSRDDSLFARDESPSAARLRIETAIVPGLNAPSVSSLQIPSEEGLSGRAAYAFRSVHVDSDHEWQFDSLRDVLATQTGGSHAEIRDREDWQHQR